MTVTTSSSTTSGRTGCSTARYHPHKANAGAAMPAHSTADTSSAPSFLNLHRDSSLSNSAPTADSAAGSGACCRLPQQDASCSGVTFAVRTMSCNFCADLLLNAPFQNRDAVVQLDAAFLLFLQHRLSFSDLSLIKILHSF